MAGSTNFIQWNPTTSPNTSNQENDSAYAVSAGNGAAVNSVFPSNVANKLFYQVTTFIAAFTQALAASGLTLSDSNIATLATTLGNIVVSNQGYSPSFNTMTCTLAVVSALESTGGIRSGIAGSYAGQYQVVDGSLVLQTGYTGTVASASGRNVVGGLIV